MEHFKAYVSVLLCTVLLGCNQSTLPEYWLCKGSSMQRVYDDQLNLLETYKGKDPLMLEIVGNTVYQFLSPAYSGKYFICPIVPELGQINMQFQPCTEWVADSIRPIRNASLNLPTGQFHIREFRVYEGKKILNDGSYTCKNLGHSFSFNDFNHGKD